MVSPYGFFFIRWEPWGCDEFYNYFFVVVVFKKTTRNHPLLFSFIEGTNGNEIWFLVVRGRLPPYPLGSDSPDTYTATTRTDGLANIQLTHES